MWEIRNSYKILVEKPRLSLKDIIKVDLKETGCENVDFSQLIKDRVLSQVPANTVMNLLVP
jgi:hypothetical protein